LSRGVKKESGRYGRGVTRICPSREKKETIEKKGNFGKQQQRHGTRKEDRKRLSGGECKREG